MIIIDSQFNGPAHTGHGGVSAGRFAALVEPDAATVRFHQPIPLGRPLSCHRHDSTAAVTRGLDTVATVHDLAGPLEVGRFAVPSEHEIRRAEQRWLEFRHGQHIAPTCFACGHERGKTGLGLRPGPVDSAQPDAPTHACTWRPEVDGRVPSWMVWAAMDCPTGFPALSAVGADEAVLTGELSVQVLKPVVGGRSYRIVSRRVGTQGRRHFTEAALYDTNGTRLVLAKAIWITVSGAVLDASVTPVVSSVA